MTSSSKRMSAFWRMARQRASFIFQPPDRPEIAEWIHAGCGRAGLRMRRRTRTCAQANKVTCPVQDAAHIRQGCDACASCGGSCVCRLSLFLLEDASHTRQGSDPCAWCAGGCTMCTPFYPAPSPDHRSFVFSKAELEELRIHVIPRDLRAQGAHVVDQVEV